MKAAVPDATDHARLQAADPTVNSPAGLRPINDSTSYQVKMLRQQRFGNGACTHWTDSELNSSLEAERCSPSAVPTPSLSSSGISSIQSNANEACPTPEAFTRTSRLPLRGFKPEHYNISGASGPGQLAIMDSDHETFGTISRSSSNMLALGRYGIADHRGKAVDWNHWHPTKFQCSFCQERFLEVLDFRTHQRTHKRYRKLLKDNARLEGSISSLEPAQKVAQDRPSVALDSGKKTPAPACTLIPSENNNYGDTRSLRNSLSKGRSNDVDRIESERDTCSASTYENTHLYARHNPEAMNIEQTTASSSFLYARHLQAALQPTRGGLGDSEDRLYICCSEDENDMVGRKDILDDADSSMFDLEMDVVEERDCTKGLSMLRSSLASTKHKLITHIMDEFMVLFKQNGVSGIRVRGNEPSQPPNRTPQPHSRTQSQVSSRNRRRQHDREENDNEESGDGDGDDDGQRAPKKFRPSPFAMDQNAKFACPYRKFDPRKYCVQHWRPCALTPLENVARVKAHLYRHHRIYQCQRCKNLFLNQSILDEHIMITEGCIPNPINHAEGVSADMEKKLRSRKKTFPCQTDADRWREIYRMLFHTTIVPSPYFEPVEESVDQLSDSAKRAEFEVYTQQELPRLFWAALEKVVTKEMQPIEERLRTQLMGMIQNCQHQVFSTYQSMASSMLDTFMGDNFSREGLLSQFEPLSRTTTSESQRTSSNIDASSNNIFACNSSATLSSVYKSSTTLNSVFTSSATLSSIASSQISSRDPPAGGDSCEEVEKEATNVLGVDDETMDMTDLCQNDFWPMDLEDVDVREFGMHGVWGAGS